MSPVYTPSNTDSAGKSQVGGLGTSLDSTPVQEPKSGMSIAPVAINSAQIARSNWMVDSEADMSGTSSTINLRETMGCKIPITPVFGAVMNATTQEGMISDPTFKKLRIKAIHIEGMQHDLLSLHQVCTGGESGDEQVGIFTSESRPSRTFIGPLQNVCKRVGGEPVR